MCLDSAGEMLMREEGFGKKIQSWLYAAVLGCGWLVQRPAPAADWTQWLGPHRDGISAEKDWKAEWPAEGPPQLWKKNVGTGYTAPVIGGDRLFMVGNLANTTDTIVCLDTKTGNEIWHY